MLNGLGATNAAYTYYTTGDVQAAILAGYSPTQWAALTPAQQQAALAQAGAFASPPAASTGVPAPVTVTPENQGLTAKPGGGGFMNNFPLFSFGLAQPTSGPSASQVQQAINAGVSPTQWAAMTSAQKQAALIAAGHSPTAGASMSPLLLIGGAGLLFLLMGKKGRR